jgi:hypothetical protein
MKKNRRWRFLCFAVFILSLFISTSGFLKPEKATDRPLKAGEGRRGPWWMKQTALSAEGRMASLRSRKWWKKTRELKPGETMMLEEGGEARDRMAVRIESYELERGNGIEVLVWLIDDDGNDSLKTGGDFHDDCYLYDLNRDAQVDLMVDYADENGDGQADFMEVRYFERGYLVQGWFGYDFENIGEIIKFKNPLDLLAERFNQNFSGKKLYFKNLYQSSNRSWWPAEVCPAASFDLNDDSLSDLVVRSNLQAGAGGPFIGSLEVSYDLDRSNTLEDPFHYDLGLVLEGQQDFDLNEFRIYSSKRRPPQEVFAIPYGKILEQVKEYKVRAAGLSWKEFPGERLNRQIELKKLEGQGIGWSWERRKLESSSSNIQKWNVRREVASGLDGSVELYYSELDQKIHLFRSEEGWLPLGNFAGMPVIGEIRYLDTDNNGFFDRREVYLANSSRPVLVLPARKEKSRKLSLDLNQLSEFYLNEALAAAMSRTDKLLQAMKEIYSYEPPPGYLQALNQTNLSEKRYLQEFYSLMYFINLRDHFLTIANQTLFQELSEDDQGRPVGDLHPRVFKDPRQVGQPLKSDRAWELARLLSELEKAYAEAEEEGFIEIIKKIKDLRL